MVQIWGIEALLEMFVLCCICYILYLCVYVFSVLCFLGYNPFQGYSDIICQAKHQSSFILQDYIREHRLYYHFQKYEHCGLFSTETVLEKRRKSSFHIPFCFVFYFVVVVLYISVVYFLSKEIPILYTVWICASGPLWSVHTMHLEFQNLCSVGDKEWQLWVKKKIWDTDPKEF